MIQLLANLFRKLRQPQSREEHDKGFNQVLETIHSYMPTYKEQVILTPNRQAGYGNKCQYIIIHHTEGWARTGDKTVGDISVCLDAKRANRVSYHCIVAWDGTRTILANDTDRAWHAGASSWAGRSDCNNFTLGLAFGGDTNTGTMRPNGSKLLTETELASAMEYIIPRLRKYGLNEMHILTHQMIAPTRKTDTSKAVLEQVRARVKIELAKK